MHKVDVKKFFSPIVRAGKNRIQGRKEEEKGDEKAKRETERKT